MISEKEEKITIRMNSDGYEYDLNKENFPIPPTYCQNCSACCWGRNSVSVRNREIRKSIVELFQKNAVKILSPEPKKLAIYFKLIYSKSISDEKATKYANDWAILIHMVSSHGIGCVFDENGVQLFPPIYMYSGGGCNVEEDWENGGSSS